MDSKIYNNINDSDIFCRCQNFKFYFSSNLRKEKFEKNYEDYADNEAYKIIYRYNLNIDFDSLKLMFIFSYYEKCEKRGIRIEKYSDDEFNVMIKRYNETPLFYITGVIN